MAGCTLRSQKRWLRTFIAGPNRRSLNKRRNTRNRNTRSKWHRSSKAFIFFLRSTCWNSVVQFAFSSVWFALSPGLHLKKQNKKQTRTVQFLVESHRDKSSRCFWQNCSFILSTFWNALGLKHCYFAVKWTVQGETKRTGLDLRLLVDGGR